MSNYGYGGRPNPYDDRGGGQGGYPAAGGYNSQPYDSRPTYNTPPPQQYGRQAQYNSPNNTPNNGRDEYEGHSVELRPLVANGQEYGQSSASDLLNEVNAIKTSIREITTGRLPGLQSLQRAVINDPDISPSSNSARELERESGAIMQEYRILTDRVRELKSNPQANSPRNKEQVASTGRALKAAINDLQQIDSKHSSQLKLQMGRQYRIVRPDASDSEVQRAIEDPSQQQVFAQALMQSDRQGKAQSALRAVESRHRDIQKIESQIIELAELFRDMENLVVQQDAAIVNIEAKGEEVVENLDKGTEQIGVAVTSAKNARKWKWWCLGISVIIILVIAIIIVLYQFVFGPNAKQNRDGTKQKRWVLPSADVFALPASRPCAKSHLKVPGLDSITNLELVRKVKRFQA